MIVYKYNQTRLFNRATELNNQQGHRMPSQNERKKIMRHVALELKEKTTKREFEAFEPILHDFLRCIVICGEAICNQNIERVGVLGRDGLVTRIAGWVWNESEFAKYQFMFNIVEQY